MADVTLSVAVAEERRLRELIGALRTPCKAHMDPKSPLNTEKFESESGEKCRF